MSCEITGARLGFLHTLVQNEAGPVMTYPHPTYYGQNSAMGVADYSLTHIAVEPINWYPDSEEENPILDYTIVGIPLGASTRAVEWECEETRPMWLDPMLAPGGESGNDVTWDGFEYQQRGQLLYVTIKKAHNLYDYHESRFTPAIIECRCRCAGTSDPWQIVTIQIGNTLEES